MTTDLWWRWGHAIARRPWPVVVAWLVILGLSIPASLQAFTVLHGGGGLVPNSQSEHVDEILRTRFDTAFLFPVLVLCRDADHGVSEAPVRRAVALLQRRLRTSGAVRDTRSYLDTPQWTMTSTDGHVTVILAGLPAHSMEEAETQIPGLRRVLDGLKADVAGVDPGLQVVVTSDTAVNSDIDELSARDGVLAERRALPFVLLCLLAAFGGLVSSALPLAVGFLSTTVTGALILCLGRLVPLSILIENVASMVGLATGIDYALVMVIRFREELAGGKPLEESIACTVATSGRAVVGSGMMVLVGMFSLFLSPLQDIRSIALGCILVVLVAMTVSLSLLPALLVWLGPWLDKPAWLQTLVHRYWVRRDAWELWSRRLMARPWLALGVGTVLIAALAQPSIHMRTGMANASWIPHAAESRTGFEMLSQMGHSGLLSPIWILVEAPKGQSMLTTERLTALYSLVQSLQRDKRIESVQSLVSVDKTMDLDEYLANYQDPSMLEDGGLREALTALLSRDKAATLIHLVPANDLPVDDMAPLVQSLRGTRLEGTDLTLMVGGFGGWVVDFHEALRKSYVPIVSTLFCLTWICLFCVFRSWLLPVKAIVMNLMSVAASFGALVMVYQWGWFHWLIRAEAPGRILAPLPLMMFCVVFGLSMDYEVFLVTRIQEFWHECGDNREATIRGLSSTGSMITSAALIMVIVFYCFALADMVFVSMLGFGLTVAVAVDATLVRVALVPAFMRLAGDYNWRPGRRKRGC